MTALVTALARWIAHALHGIAARIDAWSARHAVVAGPAVSFDGLSERFPGAPAHWLAALAEHLGEDAAALPLEQEGMEAPAERVAPYPPSRSNEANAAQHIRRARPTLIFANRSSPHATGIPSIATERSRSRIALAFATAGEKARTATTHIRRSMAGKVRLMLIPGGKVSKPVPQMPALPVRSRFDPPTYPRASKAIGASRSPATDTLPKRSRVRFPKPRADRDAILETPMQEASPRPIAAPPPVPDREAYPPTDFAHRTAPRGSSVHFALPVMTRHATPVAASAPQSSWPALPPSDAAIADAHPSFPAGRDDRNEQMVGRWSA